MTESELLKSLKSTKNDKSPGNDGLTKEFHETFWEEVKTPLSNSSISAYFFILVLEIVFTLIKTNNNIEGLNIFNHNLLYIAYADDTTFFIKNINSATEIIKTIDYFSLFSGFEINKTKCKIAGSGVLKGIKLALCGMKCVNLNDDVIKILE